jgi:amino acid permease
MSRATTTDVEDVQPEVKRVSTNSNANAAAEAGRSKLFAAVDLLGFTSFVRAKALLDHDAFADEQERDKHLASPWGTTRSLVNAAVSGGVLTLAFQIPRIGALMLVLLLAFSGFLLYTSLMMLYKASLVYKASSYTGIVRAAWGVKWSRFVAVCLVLGQFGTLTVYARVLADTIPFVVQYAAWGCADSASECDLPWYLSSAFLVTIIMVTFVIPVSLRSDPDVIASISFTTGVHFFLFLCLVVYGAATFWPSNLSPLVFTKHEYDEVNSEFANQTLSTEPFPTSTPVVLWGYDTIVAIAVLAFAMGAHTTAMPLLHGTRVHKEEGDVGKINVISKIVGGTMVSVFFYYVWIAFGCYMAFGDDVKDNCLNSFPDSNVFAMVSASA